MDRLARRNRPRRVVALRWHGRLRDGGLGLVLPLRLCGLLELAAGSLEGAWTVRRWGLALVLLLLLSVRTPVVVVRPRHFLLIWCRAAIRLMKRRVSLTVGGGRSLKKLNSMLPMTRRLASSPQTDRAAIEG